MLHKKSLWCGNAFSECIRNPFCITHDGTLLLLVFLQRQAKYSENKLKCTKARNDYLLNLAATNALVAKYYIHDVSDMIDVSHGGSSSPITSFLTSSVRGLVWFETFYPLVSSAATSATTQALRAPWEPTCRRSTAWRLLATRVWTCWRGRWTPWTSGETSWSSWTRTARSSALLRALTISRTWGMRWVTWSSHGRHAARGAEVRFIAAAALCVESIRWRSLSSF